MKKNVDTLDSSRLNALKEEHEILVITSDFDLVYEKQVPNVAIALLEGDIELTKNSKCIEKISNSCLLGVHHLLNLEPVKFGCRVKKNAKVIFLGRFEILSLLKDSGSLLYSTFEKYKLGPR